MSLPFSGRCLCDEVRFEIDELPLRAAHCHCSMCRRFHGAAYATIGGVKRRHLRLISGRDALKEYTAENGTVRTFCRRCGSCLFFSSPRASDEIVEVALGALDGDLPVVPDAHIFVGSRADWVELRDDLPKHEQGRDSRLLPSHLPSR